MTEDALPHSLDAETSTLGAFLVEPVRFEETLGRLKAQHFFRDAHQRIYRAIERLHERGSGIDFRLLIEELQRTRELDEAGGPAYVASLIDGVPRSMNVRYYANIVIEHALRRALIAEASRLTAAAYAGEDPPLDVLQKTEERLLTIERRVEGTKDPILAPELLRVMTPVLDRMWHQGGMRGLRVGLRALDAKLGGLKPGELVVIGARPSMGKSALALLAALNVATTTHVLLFSLEMSEQELFIRALAHLSDVPSVICSGGWGRPPSGETQRKIGDGGAAFSQLKLLIDDTGGLSLAQVRAKARRARRQLNEDLGLVVIDYLQLMETDHVRREDTRALELGRVSAGLKQLAKELDVPVVVLSQLNRKSEERADKRPMLSDLRESGAIEQDADVVLLLHRPGYYSSSVSAAVADIIIAKHRNGPTGDVQVCWDGEHVRFTDWLTEDTAAS